MNKKIVLIPIVIGVILIVGVVFKANSPSQPENIDDIMNTLSQEITDEQSMAEGEESEITTTVVAPTENIDDIMNTLSQEITDEQSMAEGEENDAISNEADQAVSDFGQSYGEDEF